MLLQICVRCGICFSFFLLVFPLSQFLAVKDPDIGLQACKEAGPYGYWERRKAAAQGSGFAVVFRVLLDTLGARLCTLGAPQGLYDQSRKRNVNFRKTELEKCGFWEPCRANNEKNRWMWSCLEGCVLTAGRNRKLWWWTRALGPGILWTWLDLRSCGCFCLIILTCVCHQVLNTAKKSLFTPRTITITIRKYIVLNVEE